MIEERKYKIYCHTNKINGKKYIGQTSEKNAKKRWGSNGINYRPKIKGSNIFYNAIQKYGWNNFTHEILFTNLTLNEANFLEKNLIETWKLLDTNYGYNNKEGGSNGCHTEMTRNKVSKIKKQQHIKTKGSSGMHWFNNGLEEVLCLNCPEGYKSGMLYKKQTKKREKGKKWFNNGIKQILAFSCPEGFTIGMLPMSEEHKEKLSIAAKHRTIEHRKKLGEVHKGKRTRGSKGMRWYNNGVVSILSLTCPDGYKLGRLIQKEVV